MILFELVLLQENAIKGYCDLVDSLVGVVKEQQGPSTSNPITSSGDDIIVSDSNGVRTVTLNRPKKKNAITVKVCVCVRLVIIVMLL